MGVGGVIHGEDGPGDEITDGVEAVAEEWPELPRRSTYLVAAACACTESSSLLESSAVLNVTSWPSLCTLLCPTGRLTTTFLMGVGNPTSAVARKDGETAKLGVVPT